MDYRDDRIYQQLHELIRMAGVNITYDVIPQEPEECVSAMAYIMREESREHGTIIMPIDGEAFPDADTACIALGHEMGHILAQISGSDCDTEGLRKIREINCELIGAYLVRLAEMMVNTKLLAELRGLA